MCRLSPIEDFLNIISREVVAERVINYSNRELECRHTIQGKSERTVSREQQGNNRVVNTVYTHFAVFPIRHADLLSPFLSSGFEKLSIDRASHN